MRAFVLLTSVAAASCPGAFLRAHGGHAGATVDGSSPLAWNFGPEVVVPIVVAALAYGFGLARLWTRAGVGRGVHPARAASFAAGLAILVLALMSPLDTAAGQVFSLHMVQHLLLILCAPPLLVLGAPEVPLLWALPARRRRRFARFERAVGPRVSHRQTTPGALFVVILATGVLWAWHVPLLYDLAVRNPLLHWVEHLSFLVTAMMFWTMVLRLRPGGHAGNGLRILYVFATALQGSLLGALITLAGRPLYMSHLRSAPAWGLDPLTDQQIAGLIMWVPPAALYLCVIGYLLTRWLRGTGEHRTVPGPLSQRPR